MVRADGVIIYQRKYNKKQTNPTENTIKQQKNPKRKYNKENIRKKHRLGRIVYVFLHEYTSDTDRRGCRSFPTCIFSFGLVSGFVTHLCLSLNH